jgi:hypothetical protein
LPPKSPNSVTIALVIDCDPPAATAQPCRWPAAMMPVPMAEVIG